MSRVEPFYSVLLIFLEALKIVFIISASIGNFLRIFLWETLLTGWNGCSFFLNSFITPSPHMELFTDAASTIGFGGYFNGKWFQGRWPPHLALSKDKGISIEWQEWHCCGLCYLVSPFCRETPTILVRQ